jgi:hypothetical protein
MSRKGAYTQEYVSDLMKKVDFELLEKYKNQSAPIKVRCNICCEVVHTRLMNIIEGGRPRCSCSNYTKFDKEKTINMLLERGLKPLEEYVGNTNKAWRMVCLKCNNEISPTLKNIRRGRRCKFCNRRVFPPFDKEKTINMLLERGLKPLEEYVGTTNKAWRMVCLECNNEISPTLSNIKKGQGCRFCNQGNKKYDDTIGRVYLLHHKKEKVLKIGITNQSGLRLNKYNNDWSLIQYVELPTGRMAYDLEKEILRLWRVDMGLGIAINDTNPILQKASGGYTETANEVGLNKAVDKIYEWIHQGHATDLLKR